MCDSFGLRLFEMVVFLLLSLFWNNHISTTNISTTTSQQPRHPHHDATFNTFPTTVFATSHPTNAILHGPRSHDLRGMGEGRRIVH